MLHMLYHGNMPIAEYVCMCLSVWVDHAVRQEMTCREQCNMEDIVPAGSHANIVTCSKC